jgi:hypothetical protein
MAGSDDLDAGAPARGPGTREFYTNQSFAKAFKALSNRKDADGHDMGDANADPRGFRVKQDRDWDPVRGYRANRERLRILYDYYRDVYLSSRATFSERLLWAALGRMAGGAVLGGLDQLLNTGLTIPPLTADQVANLSPADRADREKQTEVRLLVIGRNIFLDLAYQHEAFLDEPRIALDLAEKHDKAFPAKRSYLQAWKDIISSNPDDIARGNQALLENEQFSIIQPIYDKVLVDDNLFLFGLARRTSAFTNNIHPYHRPFLESKPGSNVLKMPDRMDWILEPGGMWAKWAERHGLITMSAQERNRLASLPMDDIIRHNFGPIDPILKVGGP